MAETTDLSLFLLIPSMVKVAASWVSGEGSLPGFQIAVFLLCPHMAFLQGREIPSPFSKATNPIGLELYPSFVLNPAPTRSLKSKHSHIGVQVST